MLICFFASAGAWRSPSHWRMLWDMVRFNLTAARDVLQVPFPRHTTSPEGSSGRWGASTENSRTPDRGARRDARAPAARRRRRRGFDRRRAAAAARRDGGRGQASVIPHHSTPCYAIKRHTARRDGGRGVRPHHTASYHVIQRDGGPSKRSPDDSVGYTSCVMVARPDPILMAPTNPPSHRDISLSTRRGGARTPYPRHPMSHHVIPYLSTGRWASPSVMKCHTALS